MCTNLMFSWKTASILSNNPEASASRLFGGMSLWSGGTIDRETSSGSLR